MGKRAGIARLAVVAGVAHLAKVAKLARMWPGGLKWLEEQVTPPRYVIYSFKNDKKLNKSKIIHTFHYFSKFPPKIEPGQKF